MIQFKDEIIQFLKIRCGAVSRLNGASESDVTEVFIF